MRALKPKEEKNAKALLSMVGDMALLMPTETALRKSIIDAVAPLRTLFKSSKFHDYDLQPQGDEAKLLRDAYFISRTSEESTKVSMYRPITKQGDPRIWFYKLKRFAAADEILAIVPRGKELFVFNLSTADVESLIRDGDSSIGGRVLARLKQQESAVAEELLCVLREIAKKAHLADCVGDTAVGRTLETLLGIKQNSNRQPDYKGIELKSYRKLASRANLFAQVPDWKSSKLKSSSEILKEFGYVRNGIDRLYVTVQAVKPNPQGLYLKLENTKGLLHECSSKKGLEQFLLWDLDRLHNCLSDKHRETFWIKARSEFVRSKEYLSYESVIHTINPSLSQFDQLLATGGVTLDHTIKGLPGKAAKDKGYLFKVKKVHLDLLFPKPRRYELV